MATAAEVDTVIMTPDEPVGAASLLVHADVAARSGRSALGRTAYLAPTVRELRIVHQFVDQEDAAPARLEDIGSI